MMQSSQAYEMQPAQPQAVLFGVMANFQSKITELERKLQSQSAVEQLLRERAEKPLQNDELWVKIAKALCLSFSPWGMTCFVPLDRDRGLISITLLLALIKDCFITRELLHKLFEPMKKPTEHQVYSILLPVKYQTVQEAMEDLYVMERFQVEHAMSLPFQPSVEAPEDIFKALATFIKQSPQLLDPPHIRLEEAGSRSDITQEYIGKPLGPQSLARWSEYIGGHPSHFRVVGAIFTPISPPELEAFRHVPFVERESEPAPHFTFPAYQPPYHHQSHFQPEVYAQPRPQEDYRRSTVQVSEVLPTATACERYIAAEGIEAFKQLQKDFPEERFSLLNDKEFKAIARKHVAGLKKRKREPKAKSKPRKRAERKGARKKSKKAEEVVEEVEVAQPETEDEEEEEEEQ